jgi:hypothetical protein
MMDSVQNCDTATYYQGFKQLTSEERAINYKSPSLSQRQTEAAALTSNL